MRVGTVLMAVGLLAMPLPTRLGVFLVVMLLIPIGTALLFPATSSLLSQRCDPKQLGQVMGVQQSFGGVARIFGPIWAGFAFQRFGPGVPFQVAGAVILFVALLTTRVQPGPERVKTKTTHQPA
jgi:MFS family permease